jgi:hypothetical protein
MQSHSAFDLSRYLRPELAFLAAASVLSVLQRMYMEGPKSYRASTAVHMFGILGPVICFLIPALVPAFLVCVFTFHITDVFAFN